MRQALLRSDDSWLRKVPVSGVNALLVIGTFLFCSGIGVRLCQSEPGQLYSKNLAAIVSDPSAFSGNSYVKTHTTTIRSRPGLYFAKGVVIVQLAESSEFQLRQEEATLTGDGELESLLLKHGLLRAERLFPWDCEESGGDHCRFFRLSFPEDVDLASVMGELQATAGVIGVEPVGVHPVDYCPDDSWFPVQWPLDQSEDHDVDAPECWDVEKGDSSIVVAIIDTGVDWEHPDLGGAAPYTAGNVWTNWSEFYGIDGNDDDANGFIDDYRGWDFVDGVTGSPGEDVSEADNDPMDFFGHGTHVAGIAGAIGDNGEGVAGLAYGCKVMPVRAGWSSSSGGVVRMDFCAQAVYYAARNGARIINCSWANDSSGGLDVAADTAAARGAIIVVSAGNGNTSSQTFNYLSTRTDCFAVAATDSHDVKYSLSNYGTWVDYCAPGKGVPSTYRSGTGPHTYAWMSGTSMAAPYVSALSALLLSKNPSLSRADVRSIIENACDPIDGLNPGYAGLLGAGRINAYSALTSPAIGIGEQKVRVAAPTLSQNYPNPFNPLTHISFSITEPGAIKLSIYDAAGRPVRTLVDGWRRAGIYEIVWDGLDDGGSVVASGVYFYELEVPGYAKTKKAVLLK